jgi:photosystem II stability/assembly factor-like uncharacterized protein
VAGTTRETTGGRRMDGVVLIATQTELLRLDLATGSVASADGLEGHHPTSLSADPDDPDRAWCCTSRGGVFRSEDGGASWETAGLAGERLMTIAASPARKGLIWAGTEPSSVWRSADGGSTWDRTADLEALPSSTTWAFPPHPETHHVRWIACHPSDADRLWVAVEAGALIRTRDGGRSWSDRVPGGPYDTHELAVSPAAPDVLRVAAGDGYFESRNGGRAWRSIMDGLDVGYLRSVAIDPGDPDVVVVSAAATPRSAYVAGRSDGRLYRRVADGAWHPVETGWPDPPRTIAPLLIAGHDPGEFWAGDERGVHHSADGGANWRQIAAFTTTPNHLRGIALLAGKPRS